MKIVKHGKVSIEYPKEVKCNKCGCVFIYDKEDINSFRSGDVVYCPEIGCNNVINID